MPDPINIESIDASLSVRLDSISRPRTEEDQPFRMLIIGDFSGRASRGLETDGVDIAGRKSLTIDRDNEDTVMETLGVAIHLRPADTAMPPVDLRFAELDDFHPDALYYRADIFKVLRETRKRLSDPTTFADAAAQLTGKSVDGGRVRVTATTPGTPARSPEFEKETTAGLLDDILAAATPTSGGSAASEPVSQWDRFLTDIVAPHLVPDIEKEQQALIGIIDDTISRTMADLLHHPDFQHLEAAWRGMRILVRRLETGADLKLYLLDVTKAELAADLAAAKSLERSGIFQRLTRVAPETTGKRYWGAVIGNFNFSKTKADAISLTRMGAICQHLGAPFIAGADSRMVGAQAIHRTPDPREWQATAAVEADEQAWQVIRKLPEAAWIGLALPRFIVRLPYGANADAIDAFDFEETSVPSQHEHYLWANPAFAVALVIGNTFTRHGWAFDRGLHNRIDGLPLCVSRVDDAAVTLPCAETLLGESALNALLDNGIMALVAFKDQDQVRLARLQAIASPPTALAGRWWQD